MAVCFSLCVCTLRRPSLGDSVRSLVAQQGVALSEIEIIVGDDDPNCGARPEIEIMARSAPVAIRYVESAARNISACRNACLRAARGNWIGFIDDDQTVEPTWLRDMISTATKFGADAVKCYVAGVYPPETPDWIREGDPFTYDYGPSGTEIRFGATCGILFRRSLSGGRELAFDPALGVTGGEDVEFFMRYKALGGKIVSCRSAIAREIVSIDRVRTKYLQTRSRRHGHIQGRIIFSKETALRLCLVIMKSIIGIAVTSPWVAARVVRPAVGCWMFMKFWYHLGVIEWALGRDAFHHA
jgi:succinoglycan biosynthesis protein ExoM